MPAIARNANKEERVHIRMSGSAKRTLERAAAYTHKSLSEFVIGQALESADEIIRKHEDITLTQPDWDVFLNALEHPPKPTRKLKSAFQRQRELVEQR